jgi:hypothetical protein
MLNRLCLGDDLVDEIATQELGEKLSPDPRERELLEEFAGDFLKYLLNGLKGLAADAGIVPSSISRRHPDDRVG